MLRDTEPTLNIIMIPDQLFEEGLNNTYLQNDMKYVPQSKRLYERTQKDFVSAFYYTYNFLSF